LDNVMVGVPTTINIKFFVAFGSFYKFSQQNSFLIENCTWAP
jgi:hypothetical protein